MVIPWKYVKGFILGSIILMITAAGCTHNKTTDIHVSAAASLTQVIDEMVKHYTKSHTDVKINLNYAGTNTLKMQVEEGADVDLFLSANFKYYDELNQKGFIQEGEAFAKNKLCVIKHKDNQTIHTIEDLTQPDLKIIIGNKDVPIGKYTLEVLNKLDEKYGPDFSEKVLENVVSQETNVKRIVTKINLNEGDAGFVYMTDMTDAVRANVEHFEIEDQYNVLSHYYAGIIKKDTIKDETERFYQFILSKEGQDILKQYGFIMDEKE
ncbi:molybdate ABC transporter substrate-binding protein [Vallitalea pronyensis]|uniref:Molybdate ABC transporter substrate-binding protein n=1 Tax=Vallitalea pronyensis TaxID=1348613 RepID=A0A8J8MLP7_9FIRM|nr:molybdate ABC transporter substrate-binding protein [Vallitalea pronyensis]QUI23558.1 molybdate ABC transporter substrate-binding protein [Vallitalea pronyensis]